MTPSLLPLIISTIALIFAAIRHHQDPTPETEKLYNITVMLCMISLILVVAAHLS